MKARILFYLFFIPSIYTYAQPPAPASGYRWVLWDQYSDEFDGTSLDRSKWRDYFVGWNGRSPAKFDPSTISVQNGDLRIRNKKLKVKEGPYTMAGGAVQSLEKTAHFGYYECKFKASRVAMSTTFWMSNPKRSILGRTKLTGDCANDKWSQELDICESIGGVFNGGSKFRTQMNFNTHYRYINCNNAPEVFYSAGNNAVEGNGQDADADLIGSESWEDYHTYGCYWKDPKTFDFYVDEKFAGTVIGRTDVVDKPFTEPMGINMVTETYNWAKPYPSDADLANNAINTSYYDWIRSYRLIPILEPEFSGNDDLQIPNGNFENGNLSGWTGWGGTIRNITSTEAYEGRYAGHIKGAGAHEKEISLKANTAYILSAYVKVVSGNIIFGIKENTASGQAAASVSLNNTKYQKVELRFTTGSETSLKFFLFAEQTTDEGFGDNFEIVNLGVDNPKPIKPAIFIEEFSFVNKPVLNAQANQLNLSYTYKANVDRELQIHIYNNAGVEVFTQTMNALEGYGVNEVNFDIGSNLPADDYTIVVDLRPIDGADSEIIDSDATNTTILSVIDVNKDTFSVQLYPNPASSLVHFKTKKGTRVTSVKVYDILGKNQLSTSINKNEKALDISTLTKGVYFVTFQNGKAKSTTIKIQVE
ncbi:T9SS type A sorting domain-containing protein [Aquimarina sp. ERC-38]|uniref:T9SS type A sorting domain-containing protein n=1 Tax=Aquimarina sp. ERC-38 TaxID=2949996 RepID=UPI00224803A3|nr:T9SS type A sorting domain-containing protein [Aquimarina sp. ERC-38]UZO80702.1 T9SS type A sorting domain-containing protein [Aquimarina sp. ERC-38]